MPMETCKVCDKNSAQFHNCAICRLYCCRDCYFSHVGSCKYIKDDKCSTCTIHQEQVEKYCFNCRQLICHECIKSGHPTHTILQLGVATGNIKSGIPNAETELAEKDEMCLQNLDTYRRIQQDYKDIVRRVKEEEKKWTTLISDISRSLVHPLNTNIEMIETKCKEVEHTCEMIKYTKHQFRDLEIAQFPLNFLFKWSNAMKLKDKSDERSKGNVINKQIIERGELEKNKDMAAVFQNLVLNVAKMKDSPAETMDTLTAQFLEISLKEPPSQTMSGRQFQDEENYCKDTPGNARHLKEPSCKEISKNKMEESASLKCQNERLREQIQNMSDEMANYQEEQTYMLDMLNSLLPDKMTQIDRATNKATVRFEELPRQPNDFMNKCTTAIEAIMIRYMKMKEDLIKAKQDLDDNCKSIAEWTMKVNYDSEEEMKAYQEQNKKIELKGKYANRRTPVVILETSNQILEQEVMKKKKELVDLQKSLEIEREESRKKDRFIEKFQAKETHLQSQIRNQENMQSLKLEKDNLKTKLIDKVQDLAISRIDHADNVAVASICTEP
ncbi:unnamed protein product [Mytilus coruscus]|uniref:B box-type domain-containing protein n=1 Tax=Mytilus coruscus TaxID=42192 RepID=A0A6J8CA09_MYTCO|nr:unnamed protein product [Mytilus coruscus]